MHIQFLGTSAGRPTKSRNVTSAAFVHSEPASGFWLFDAGEGTQQQMFGTKLKLNKLEKIFVTHLHGDHIYGLPGLLSSRSYFDGAGPLVMYGPPGLRAFIDGVFMHSGTYLEYELTVTEIGPGVIMDDGHYRVTADELVHRLPSFGYRIEESAQSGQLDLEQLARRGVEPGPAYGKLKRGEDIILPSGELVRSAEVVGPPVPGRIVTILGDTCPCENGIALARNADLLVHEATFESGMEEKATAYGHSTVRQAAQIAADAGAKQLALTHFSSRYDDEAITELIAEGQKLFPNIVAAYDYMELPVPRQSS
ncbi:ribonuclease Z [Paenibacillus mendelii]|uniref:Ribonuclease Z n=1 Tax=Paenibacillus mendelii TaxID=206163 RepID=A0ABV6J5I5_9BACL|nr:ribonuclease Z [Paenibacillus mendelii]MCQ6560166.1 ribonuclease Z [Paenibacillus mendelii]